MAGVKDLRYDDLVLCLPTQYRLSDDFLEGYSSGQKWTTLATGSGASVALLAGGPGGQIKVVTGTTAPGNDSGPLETTANFLPAAGGVIYAETVIQYAEASTNKANVFFGLSSAAAAGLMTDGAMGTGSQTTVGIFKIDGGTQWNCFTSNGTTVQTQLSNATAGGTNWQWLRIEINDSTGINAECKFFLNDLPLLSNTTPNRPIVLPLPLASAVAMKAVPLYMATGSGSNAETGYCDWCNFQQRRLLTGQY